MKNNSNNPSFKTAREKYNEIVEDFISKLENNQTETWTKSWNSLGAIPKSYATDNTYQGINLLTLMSKGYSDSRFLTFNQIKQMGGSVRKGEKSNPIFFYKPVEKEIVNEDGEVEIKKSMVIKSYNVFNITQTQNIEYTPESTKDVNKIDEIEKYIDSQNIQTFNGAPAYDPNSDSIFMLDISQFENESEYYSTFFHELIHSTGSKSKLDRFTNEKYKSSNDNYAYEELVAELGSIFLSNEFNINPNSKKKAAYLEHWINALKEKPNILFSAASQASKAVGYLNNKAQVREHIQIQDNPIEINLDEQTISKSKYQAQNQSHSKPKNNTHTPQAS